MSKTRYIPRTLTDAPSALFSNTEEAWFWFIRCQRVRREGARFSDSRLMTQRPCDPDDIYRGVVELARSGVIGGKHLTILGTFGLWDRPPDARRPEERRASQLWDEALHHLTVLFRKKGIVE